MILCQKSSHHLSKKKLRNSLGLLFLFNLLVSCSIPKIYRATIGISSNNATFKSVTSDSDGDKNERKLCVEDVNSNVTDAQKCSGGGYKEDKGLGFWDPWIELYPYYFGKSSFGFSYFFSFNHSETTLLDYPVVGEKSDIEIDRISFNPTIYYNFGDNFIGKNGGMSLRVGIGAAINYVYKFSVTRNSTGEENSVDTKVKPGVAAFFEYNWNWFTFRVENSQIEYEGRKFEGVEKDTLVIENNKASVYYSYYF